MEVSQVRSSQTETVDSETVNMSTCGVSKIDVVSTDPMTSELSKYHFHGWRHPWQVLGRRG